MIIIISKKLLFFCQLFFILFMRRDSYFLWKHIFNTKQNSSNFFYNYVYFLSIIYIIFPEKILYILYVCEVLLYTNFKIL